MVSQYSTTVSISDQLSLAPFLQLTKDRSFYDKYAFSPPAKLLARDLVCKFSVQDKSYHSLKLDGMFMAIPPGLVIYVPSERKGAWERELLENYPEMETNQYMTLGSENYWDIGLIQDTEAIIRISYGHV